MADDNPLAGLTGPGQEPEHDRERTTDELTEVLATGNTVEVYLGHISFTVALDRVDVHLRVPLEADAIQTLRESLPSNVCQLHLPPLEEVTGGATYVDGGEYALLHRALEARRRLTGT